MDIFSLQKINLQNISSLSGNFVYGHHGQVLFLIDRNYSLLKLKSPNDLLVGTNTVYEVFHKNSSRHGDLAKSIAAMGNF